MSELISYIIEINISISVFFLLYHLLFRKDSNFGSRRFFLLFAIVFSALVPLGRFELTNPATSFFSPIYIFEGVSISGRPASSVASGVPMNNLLPPIITTYMIVTLFFLVKLLLNVLKIMWIAFKSRKIIIGNRKVCLSQDLHASSFFNYIFIDPAKISEDQLKYILEHEACHVRLVHSLDRILIELMLGLTWINPLVWILRRYLVANNEYQADNRVVSMGNDQVGYQLTILNQYIGSASVSNQFSSQIKNRITMLNKKYKKGNTLKNLMLFPVSIFLVLFIGCKQDTGNDDMTKNEKIIDDVFYVVDEMPHWPGEDDFAMAIRKFIAKNLMYPEEAHENRVEGKIFVQFMVTKTGRVIVPDPSMLPPSKDENGNIDEVVVVTYRPFNGAVEMPDNKYIQLLKDESIRVIELLPDLVPGKQNGQEVNVLFTMPIHFKLE